MKEHDYEAVCPFSKADIGRLSYGQRLIRFIFKKKICTQQEVVEILNIFLQMVSKLVKQSKLTHLSSIHGFNGFAIDSVKEYIKK